MNKIHKLTLITLIFLISCESNRDTAWNYKKLYEARNYSIEIGSFAFILATNDSIIISWGDLTTPTELHSARKSISSSIYAIYTGEGEGQLNLNKTMEEIGIDDYPVPLTDLQKRTKMIHLIQSISGINHAAAAETDGMREGKTKILGDLPNVPGTIWAYNNWDYNTMISIFERETGIKEKDAFLENIAIPLQMEDISESTVSYHYEPELSNHPAIAYQLSARDMLKFGQLCLNKGKYNEIQIIPETYFEKITSDYTVTGEQGLRSGYGYMWWVPVDRIAKEMHIPKGTFLADGLGSQQIIVIPEWETVMVHKTRTNFTEGFLMWLGQNGYTQSDSTYIMNNLIVFQNDFLDFIVNGCKDQANADNPICTSCLWVEETDYFRFLQMIFAARK